MRNNYFVLFMSPVITSMDQTISIFSQIDFNINLMLIIEYTRVENNIGQWNKVMISKMKVKGENNNQEKVELCKCCSLLLS